MRFFNRFAQVYALIVIALTLGYYYAGTHLLVNSKEITGTLLFAFYLALVFATALFMGVKDEENGYAGFNYHFITYIIAMGLPLVMILATDNSGNRDNNIQALLLTMLFWGIGLLFHLGIYLFMFRKKKIGSYQKEDVFR